MCWILGCFNLKASFVGSTMGVHPTPLVVSSRFYDVLLLIFRDFSIQKNKKNLAFDFQPSQKKETLLAKPSIFTNQDDLKVPQFRWRICARVSKSKVERRERSTCLEEVLRRTDFMGFCGLVLGLRFWFWFW